MGAIYSIHGALRSCPPEEMRVAKGPAGWGGWGWRMAVVRRHAPGPPVDGDTCRLPHVVGPRPGRRSSGCSTVLRGRGYAVVGPVVRDGAIVAPAPSTRGGRPARGLGPTSRSAAPTGCAGATTTLFASPAGPRPGSGAFPARELWRVETGGRDEPPTAEPGEAPRVHRRSGLRAACHRDSGPGPGGRAPTPTRATRRAAEAPSSSR